MVRRGGRVGALFCGVVVGLIFLISRVVYFRAGIRFDPSAIDYFAQLLDRALLRERLAESLFYLHAQPPLYNLLVGLALKVAPVHPQWVLAPAFMAAGLYATLCLYVILLYLRVPVRFAALVAAAIGATPLFVIYENWCFYPALNVAWITGAGAWLARSHGRPGLALAVAALHVGGLCLTRSLFHPLFFVLVMALVLAFAVAGTRRRVLACFAVPALLVCALCVKNLALFGFFGTSSWASRNLWRGVTCVLGPDVIKADRKRLRLSPAVNMTAFQPGDRNIAAFHLKHRHTGVPALDEVAKSNPSILPVNYNHWSIPKSAHFYGEDAVKLVRAHPGAYVRGVLTLSAPRFFEQIDQGFTDVNHARIRRAANAFDAFDQARATQIFVGVGLLFACVMLVRRAGPRSTRLLLAFSVLVLVWVTVVGILGEWGENYRFRYNVVWLGWALAIAGYASVLRQLGAVARARARVPERALLAPPGADAIEHHVDSSPHGS